SPSRCEEWARAVEELCRDLQAETIKDRMEAWTQTTPERRYATELIRVGLAGRSDELLALTRRLAGSPTLAAAVAQALAALFDDLAYRCHSLPAEEAERAAYQEKLPLLREAFERQHGRTVGALPLPDEEDSQAGRRSAAPAGVPMPGESAPRWAGP